MIKRKQILRKEICACSRRRVKNVEDIHIWVKKHHWRVLAQEFPNPATSAQKHTMLCVSAMLVLATNSGKEDSKSHQLQESGRRRLAMTLVPSARNISTTLSSQIKAVCLHLAIRSTGGETFVSLCTWHTWTLRCC